MTRNGGASGCTRHRGVAARAGTGSVCTSPSPSSSPSKFGRNRDSSGGRTAARSKSVVANQTTAAAVAVGGISAARTYSIPSWVTTSGTTAVSLSENRRHQRFPWMTCIDAADAAGGSRRGADPAGGELRPARGAAVRQPPGQPLRREELVQDEVHGTGQAGEPAEGRELDPERSGGQRRRPGVPRLSHGGEHEVAGENHVAAEHHQRGVVEADQRGEGPADEPAGLCEQGPGGRVSPFRRPRDVV